MNQADLKKALDEWEEFRKSIAQSTPVDRDETPAQKAARIKELEANPQKWKEYYFPKYLKAKSPQFHINASRRLLDNFLKKKHWYEVRHWARGLSKSTTTMFDVLFLVMTGKLRNIILASSTYDAAEKFLTKYQCELDSNQRLMNDYGKQERPGSWAMGCFTTLNGAKFLALGAGQSPRGTSNEEIRPDCIIIDDFDTDEECRNSEIIDKKWRWFETALFFTVDVSGPYLIIWLGNIIAEDCCVVRAGNIADHCEIINIRDEFGRSVWPEKNSEEDIDYQESKVGYDSVQQENYNNPVRTGKAFPEMKWGKVPPVHEMSMIVIYADPATSNKDKPSARSRLQNSNKAVAIVGAKGLYRYVIKCFVDSVNNDKFIDWLFAANDHVRSARIVYTYIENNTLQDPFYEQVLSPLIKRKSKERGYMLPVLGDTRKKPDKYVRIEAALEPLNRNGFLILNEAERGDPHMKRMEVQFKSVSPTSKTMDGPDAVEGADFIIKCKALSGTGKLAVVPKPVNPKRR